MSLVIDYDLIPTALTQAMAVYFKTPLDAQGKPTWQLLSNSYQGSSCFSCNGRFFDLPQGREPNVDVHMRFAVSTYSTVQPQLRLAPINYPNNVQKIDHTWPISMKNPAYNPNLEYQNVKAKWDVFWADPINIGAGGIFLTMEVCGEGYLYMARFSLVFQR